jgi:hypothetical protein
MYLGKKTAEFWGTQNLVTFWNTPCGNGLRMTFCMASMQLALMFDWFGRQTTLAITTSGVHFFTRCMVDGFGSIVTLKKEFPKNLMRMVPLN